MSDGQLRRWQSKTEHRAFARGASGICRSIKRISRQSQTAIWISSTVTKREAIERGKTSTVGVDSEDRSASPLPAPYSHPVNGVARQNQSGSRANSIAIGITITGSLRETVNGEKTCAVGLDGEYRAIS